MTGSFDVGRGTVGVIVSGSMKVWGRAVVTRGVVGLDDEEWRECLVSH